MRGQTNPAPFIEIEKLRYNLITNTTPLTGVDLGAGSHGRNGSKTIGDVARASLTPKDIVEFYFRIIQFSEATRIVELGSCLGVTTLYLAKRAKSQIYTFEGNHALANISLTNYEYFDQKNIHLIEGNLDSTLPEFAQDPAKISFVLMDANHRYEPTIKYFNIIMRRLTEKSVVVVDDIHWSEEMEQAWNELRQHPVVYGSVDLFRFGILFFDPALNRQHFVWSLN